MKNFLFALLALCALSASLFGNIVHHSDEKLYVSADSVMVEESGIYIQHGHTRIPVESINVDAAGIFVLLPETREYMRRCSRGHDILCQCNGCCSNTCPNRCRCSW